MWRGMRDKWVKADKTQKSREAKRLRPKGKGD